MDLWKIGVLQKGSYLKNFNVEDPRSGWETRHPEEKLRNKISSSGWSCDTQVEAATKKTAKPSRPMNPESTILKHHQAGMVLIAGMLQRVHLQDENGNETRDGTRMHKESHQYIERTAVGFSEKARKASIGPVGQDVAAAEGQEYTDVMRHYRLMQSLPTLILVLLFLVTLMSEDRGYGEIRTVTADDHEQKAECPLLLHGTSLKPRAGSFSECVAGGRIPGL